VLVILVLFWERLHCWLQYEPKMKG
jgi:hypothetical protein